MLARLIDQGKPIGLEEFNEEPEYRLEAPKAAGFLAYSTAHDQPLRGIPIREGTRGATC